MLTNFGIEGVTFEFDENGKPQALDIIKNNETFNVTGAQHYYLIHQNFVMDLDRTEASMSEECLKYNTYWGEPGAWNFSAAVSYTPEETSARATIQSDLDVCFSETFVSWVIGAAELNDDTWNEYVARMESIGVDEYVEITQTAYERWLSK